MTGTTAALTLSAEIRQRFDEFSRSQKDVGQYIVDHLDEASFHTAEELARRANTSSSTVVRFAQALGFEGFPELQAAARDEYRRAREGADGVVDLANPPLFPIDQTEFEAALAADHVNVEETARRLDRDEVTASIELISRADRIVLCGTDQMAFFASYLRHLLMLLDLRCEVVASPSQEGLAKLGRIDERTVLVGLLRGSARIRSSFARSSWPATAAQPPSPWWTPRSPRWPSWPTTSSSTPPTAPPTCARTPRCWGSCRRSPTASTPSTSRPTPTASRPSGSSSGAASVLGGQALDLRHRLLSAPLAERSEGAAHQEHPSQELGIDDTRGALLDALDRGSHGLLERIGAGEGAGQGLRAT